VKKPAVTGITTSNQMRGGFPFPPGMAQPRLITAKRLFTGDSARQCPCGGAACRICLFLGGKGAICEPK